MILHLLIFLTSFIGSFIFAGYETGLVSVNPIKVDYARTAGDKIAGLFSKLLKVPSRVVATVLIGNNFALVGMQSSFAALLYIFFGEVSSILETAVLTVLALIFCELLPKSLFRIYSFRITRFFTPLIWLLYVIFTPLTKVFDLLNSIGGSKESSAEGIATAELHAIATEGGRSKELNPMIALLSESLFSLAESEVGLVVAGVLPESTPVSDEMLCFSADQPADKLLDMDLLLSDTLLAVEANGGVKVYSSKKIFEMLIY